MKKIIIKFLIILSIFGSFGLIQNTYALEPTNIINVTAKIPGGNCVYDTEIRLYVCTTPRGFGAIMLVMGEMLKYFTYLAGLFGVLGIVVGGIMYSMGGASDSLKTGAKEYIVKTIIGLIVLLLTGPILYMVAPWIYN